VPDPSDLIAVARLLSAQSPSTDAQLRRAVSTAYYAVFHTILRAAARRFIGVGHEASAAYTLIYRGFEHGRIKAVCVALSAPRLNDKLRFSLGKSAVSQEMRDFASAFPSLQDARHLADYHPSTQFLPSDASSIIDGAELAMDAFDRTTPEEQADVLALLMVGARG
jgi:hypothetical protein